MTYTFEKAEPVAITGTGAKKADNPFTKVVAEIAWKNDKTTGKPEARACIESHDGDPKSVEKLKNRIRRQVKDAGDALETPGTVRTAFENLPGNKLKITFWVVKLQIRERKPKPAATPDEKTVK